MIAMALAALQLEADVRRYGQGRCPFQPTPFDSVKSSLPSVKNFDFLKRLGPI